MEGYLIIRKNELNDRIPKKKSVTATTNKWVTKL